MELKSKTTKIGVYIKCLGFLFPQEVHMQQPGKPKEGFQISGWPFKASEKILVNRVLLSPIRENIEYPKGLPSYGNLNEV